MSDNQIDRRVADAIEKTEIKDSLKYLTLVVDKIDSKVDNLDCKTNTKKIDTMWDIHVENKQYKQHIVKTILTNFGKAGGFIIAGATAVYAYLK